MKLAHQVVTEILSISGAKVANASAKAINTNGEHVAIVDIDGAYVALAECPTGVTLSIWVAGFNSGLTKYQDCTNTEEVIAALLLTAKELI